MVVVRRESDGWRFLFLRAYRNWDFPKGLVEEGEDPLETAVREVREETGITQLSFRWGDRYRETLPYSSKGKKVARYYLAETSETSVSFSVNPELGRPEHHEHRWIGYDRVREIAPQRLLPILDWANRVIIGGEDEKETGEGWGKGFR